MRRSFVIPALVSALITVPLMANAQTTPPVTPPVDTAAPEVIDFDAATVLATVDGKEITLGHVIVMMSRLPEQYLSAPDEILMDGILEQMIDQQLLSQRLAQDAEQPLEVRLLIENETRAVMANSAIQEFAELEFDEAAIQAAYDAEFGALEPEKEFNASHILVETEDEAKAIIAELEGGADFAEQANEKSSDGDGTGGGLLGWFGLGMMVPEFEAAVVALEPGKISGPVQSQFGWHVIKMNETRDRPMPTLEETSEDLIMGLRQTAMSDALDAMRAEATIEMSVEGIPATAIRQTDLLKN